EEGERLRAAWPDADIQPSEIVPATRSNILARVVVSRDAVRGEWRKVPVLLTPQREEGVTHLLKLPLDSVPASYTLTLLAERLSEQPRGGLGLVLLIGDRHGLLMMDDVPGAPWRIERLGSPTYSRISATDVATVTRINPAPGRYIQVTVQPSS